MADFLPTESMVVTRLLEHLKALNGNLDRFGVPPLVTIDAAEALELDNLRAAVKVTGDRLVDVARKMSGL